jgi:hypothetical protein
MGWYQIGKIPDKCEFCDKKAEYFLLRTGLLLAGFRLAFVCNEHRKGHRGFDFERRE